MSATDLRRKVKLRLATDWILESLKGISRILHDDVIALCSITIEEIAWSKTTIFTQYISE